MRIALIVLLTSLTFGIARADDQGAAPSGAGLDFGQDLMSHSAGTAVVRVTSEYNSGTVAFALLDGTLDSHWRANTEVLEVQEAVFELAARARLTHAGAGVGEAFDWAAGQRVTVEAADSPDGPWTRLFQTDLRLGQRDVTAIEPTVEARYIRVVLPARSNEDAPSVLVSDVVIGGSFIEPVLVADFAGAWNGGWLMGSYRLVQDGVTLRGCFEDGRQIAGTVDGRVAALRFRDRSGNDVTGEFLMSAGEEKPLLLQIFDSADAPPSQALGAYVAVDAPNCTIDEPRGAGAVDPLQQQLADDGKALVYDILFDFNKAVLKPESGPVLDRIASVLTAQPTWRLAVNGHTDNVGGAAYNQQLSEERARAAMAALVERGIAAERLTAAGFGAGQPVADNATSGGRARNRRVELVRN